MALTPLFVLGHSFVEGTEHHLRGGLSSLTGSETAKRLHLSNLVKRVYLLGQRGAAVSHPVHNLYSLPSTLLNRVRPSYAIVDLGSNDLAAGVAPLEVATKLVDLANLLIEDHGLTHVTLCQILKRNSGLGHLTQAQFADLAYQTNNYLRIMCEGEVSLSYHVHQGFWDRDVTIWSQDGIHPNRREGRKLYIKSLRRALFKAITHVKKTSSRPQART